MTGDQEPDVLLRAFEEHRAHLLRVAYATLGSLAEAEDCVQEAWLRLRRVSDPAGIRDLRGWLTTTVGRLALDALGSARARRERYVGTWLPEPLVEPGAARSEADDPAERVTLDESVSMALLVILEKLSPPQRTAFLLHDVFGLSFEEVAEVVGRSPAAVRQLAARARQHVEHGRPRFPPTHDEQRRVVAAFAAACQEGDLEQLITMLDPDVVWRGDGGGKVVSTRAEQRGSEKVARGLVAFATRIRTDVRFVSVNGAPGLVLREEDGTVSVCSLTMDAGRIVAIDVVRNPDKLTGLPDLGPGREPDPGPGGAPDGAGGVA
ncbi:RNA polymerase sigma factor SigJ [Streptomyces sp. B6B3]|uniref:RNA polymerase sigma factor SigJ n=1 Tax=Streptomyces sp. B6B3 TaxID=3153570 RepID=UPI00325DE25B